MLDLKFVCDNPEAVRAALDARGASIDLSQVVELSRRRKELIQAYEVARSAQNRASESMQKADKKSPAFAALRDEMRGLSERAKAAETELRTVEEALREQLLYIPNIPRESVPRGADAAQNVERKRWGALPVFDFKPLTHDELGTRLGILDFERGAKLAQSRFTLVRAAGARLERALINFMLDHARERGYDETLPPFIVNRRAMIGTGQLPKFEEDAFSLEGGALFLVPTAEVPLTNIYQDEILEATTLPIKLAAYTPCFRREAGSYGKDTKGLIRQHQFNKVELVKIVAPETSVDEHETLTRHAEEILEALGLPYRRMHLCTGDIGFSAAECFDLEVWLPGPGEYREISSCSNFGDYQARRIGVRVRDGKGKPRFPHTINGSALAVGRTLVAVLENNQTKDGKIRIPDALVPYMGGATIIE
ncbi:MAG: serine--tRNA ligase [Deltaproteobacteria bacterium]|nr:serine--tRNA ligase [Deltaproteobacteria bacterium]